jgi:tRNA threonylcarbamoyladenosine biosynthesis protein TsaB
MKILACDTSTLLGSVAVSDGERILSERSLQRAGSHSDAINGMIRDCLSEANIKLNEIDLFISGLGPGSFTGIRISLNTIKTFAYVNNKPCVGVDSLTSMAEKAKDHVGSITVMINAFKNMLYIAEYKSDGKNIEVVKSPQVVRVQDLKSFLTPETLVVGDGYMAYADYIQNKLGLTLKRSDDVSDFPVASTLCHIYRHKSQSDVASKNYHWSNLIPIYLRASEAEENLSGIKYVPL